jgi:hypothetical protein
VLCDKSSLQWKALHHERTSTGIGMENSSEGVLCNGGFLQLSERRLIQLGMRSFEPLSVFSSSLQVLNNEMPWFDVEN